MKLMYQLIAIQFIRYVIYLILLIIILLTNEVSSNKEYPSDAIAKDQNEKENSSCMSDGLNSFYIKIYTAIVGFDTIMNILNSMKARRESPCSEASELLG